ncbi:MAG: hypothetical protein IPH59_14705 [bacterium]|nr:hypothetical protein [bacterium]
MKLKSIVTVALLLFVAVSLTVVVMRNTSDSAVGSQGDSAAAVEGDKVIAYYFHRTQRCPTCNRIEALAHEIVHQSFAEELGSKKLELRVVNIESEGNEHFETDFSLVSQSIVLVDMKSGKMTKWKNLDQIWELIGTEAEFRGYVETEIRNYLSAS